MIPVGKNLVRDDVRSHTPAMANAKACVGGAKGSMTKFN